MLIPKSAGSKIRPPGPLRRLLIMAMPFVMPIVARPADEQIQQDERGDDSEANYQKSLSQSHRQFFFTAAIRWMTLPHAAPRLTMAVMPHL